MRLARVEARFSYVVDLDDPAMVDEARECVVEDICNAVKFGEEAEHVRVGEPDPSLKPEDIPSFLTEGRD